MPTKLTGDQIENKTLLGSHLADNPAINGTLSVSSRFVSTDRTSGTPNSTLEINNGVKIYSNSRLILGKTPLTENNYSAYDVAIKGNTVIDGDLDLTGHLNYIGSITDLSIIKQTVNLADNTILLNSGLTTGTPTVDAGLEIRRGSFANARLYWNETNNRWEGTYPGDNATPPTSHRIVDENYGDGRYLRLAGSTMTGNMTFSITNINASTSGIVWTGLTDTHSIFTEEYGGSQSTRLVIRSQDDGDTDYTVFRNNSADIFEVRSTYVRSHRNFEITGKRLTIDGMFISAQTETIPTYAAGAHLNVYLKDSLYIHSGNGGHGNVRLYSSNDGTTSDILNNGTTFSITSSTANHTFAFRNSTGDRFVIDKDGNATSTGFLRSSADLYLSTARVGFISNSILGSTTSGTFIIANSWNWDTGAGIRANNTSRFFEIGTADKLGHMNSANAMTNGIKLMNNTNVDGTLTVIDVTMSSVATSWDGGATGRGLRIANANGNMTITPLSTAWTHIATDKSNFIFDKTVYTTTGAFSANSTTNLSLQTAGTTRMTVLATNGNVGIGTTTPGNKLQVIESIGINNPGGNPAHNLVLSARSTYANDAQSAHIWTSDGRASGDLAGQGGHLIIEGRNSTERHIIVRSGGTERIRILGTGNVGLGITTPAANLDIQGSVGQYAVIINSGGLGSLRWGNGAQGHLSWDTNRVMVGGLSNNVLDLIAGGSTAVRVATNGNVGIGTTSPSARLHISGDQLISGKLGIDTTSPSTALHVNFDAPNTTMTGTSAFGGIHLQQSNTNDEFVGITTSATSSGTQGGILFQGSGSYGSKIHFLTTNSYATGQAIRMTLDHTGRLGIGTTSPAQALDVSGNIAVSGNVDGVKVSTFKTAFDARENNIFSRRRRMTKVLSTAVAQDVNIALTTIDAGWTGTWTSDSIVLVMTDGYTNAPGADLDYTISGTNTIRFNYDLPVGTVLDIIIM